MRKHSTYEDRSKDNPGIHAKPGEEQSSGCHYFGQRDEVHEGYAVTGLQKEVPHFRIVRPLAEFNSQEGHHDVERYSLAENGIPSHPKGGSV
jgi:hypothetical protein